MNTIIEFWDHNGGGLIIGISTNAPPPPVGSLINIMKVDYEVVSIDYAIDHGGEVLTSTYRRNVYLRQRGLVA